jgi:hypothetical protein
MNYGPPPRHLVDTIIPQRARDMAKYQTDPKWAAQLIGDEEGPPADKYPLGPVLLAVGAVSIILWCAIAIAALKMWRVLFAGG